MSDQQTSDERLRILVVFGGRSGEHEVSLQSAQAVIAALREAGHEVVPLGITREGRWLAGGDPLAALSAGDPSSLEPVALLPEPASTSGAVSLSPLEARNGRPPIENVDLVFPVLHGTYGEDGTLQGLFELAAVPYAGAGVLGSALGMDKIVQNMLWRGLGLPVVDFVGVMRSELDSDADAVLDRVEQALPYPVFTKPANLGSSVGVSKARTREELRAGLESAARYDHKLLVERGIDARELEVGVLGNEDAIASVVGEILPGADFYDYRAKYIDSGSQALIPAEIPAETAEAVRTMAVAAFQAVDGSGLARVDFFLDRRDGRWFVNEVNTLPGFTEVSMYARMWQQSGLDYRSLLSRLIELGLARFEARRALSVER
jgi:D-alanine-D-alanine ligase